MGRTDVKRLRMIEAAYPLHGRGRGGLRTLDEVKNVDIDEQTHPPKRENNVLLLGVYPLDFGLA